MFIIYMHTSPSGKSYIGKTKFSLEKRWKDHQAMAKFGKNHLIHKAIRKYGAETFTSVVLEENVPDEKASERERYWISFYNTYKKGYNMTEGGEGRSFISESQKEAIRKHNRERVLSEETLKKMSESAKKRGAYSQESYDKASRKKSKLANIYDYQTNELLYENVYLFEWLRDHPECSKSSLTKTANPKSGVKQHKGYYVKWVQSLDNN